MTTEPLTEEQARAAEVVHNLLQLLVKGLRATQLYLPNNPVYQKAVESVRAGFEPVWEYCTELELDVHETDLVFEGHRVLEQPTKSESVAWVLYKDGVRRVTFTPGVEGEELVRFLNVVNRARNLPQDAEDDLLTLLWEQDFQFVKYDFVELGQEEVPQLERSDTETPNAEEVRQQIQEEAPEEPERPRGIVNLDDFDSTLYFLDPQEIEYLNSEVEREYAQDLRANVLAMIFDLLELQTYPTVRAELISILENFTPYLLAVGDFRSVAYVLRELRVVLQRARELLPEHRTMLSEFPARLSEPEALGQLLQSLDEAVIHPTEDELSDLFRELRPSALGALFEWLPRLTNERVRTLLDAAARRLCQAYPDEVSKALKTDNREVLIQIVRIVGQLKLPPVIPALGELLGNPDPAVRRAVVESLAAIATPGALKHLEAAVDDTDREVRVNGVRAMARHGHRGAFEKIEAMIHDRGLQHADLTEKTAFFEAYGRLAGAAGMKTLRGMLESKGFLKRKLDPETRACAAMALGKIGTAEARDMLSTVANDKDPLVRNAVNKALKEIA